MAASRSGLWPEETLGRPNGRPDPIGAVPGSSVDCDSMDRSHFFEICFGATATPAVDPRRVLVPLRTLNGHAQTELWKGPTSLACGVADGIESVASDDYLLMHAREPCGVGVDVAPVTEALYGKLLRRAAHSGYPHLVRVWNIVPDINRGVGDAESYVRFNRGRALAFEQFAIQQFRYSAATAVGGPADTPLTVTMLASRNEPVPMENPRQVSAYQYPRQYGPLPPAFARATFLRHARGGTLFISGTASIVGHASRHQVIEAQLAETLANIRQMLGAVRDRAPELVLGAQRSWRVYLRHPQDSAAARRAVASGLDGLEQVLFLQADICRRELLVEVEGVCEFTARAGAEV